MTRGFPIPIAALDLLGGPAMLAAIRSEVGIILACQAASRPGQIKGTS